MRAFIAAVLFISIIGSCKGDGGEKHGAIVAGVYKGTFTRMTKTGAKQYDVTIQFTADKFEAKEVGVAGYTGTVGQGSYFISGKKINFVNYGFFTAEFDWTVVLSGKYSLSIKDNTIQIVREYESVPNGTLKDSYVLVKQ